jgi:hypothetical protein
VQLVASVALAVYVPDWQGVHIWFRVKRPAGQVLEHVDAYRLNKGRHDSHATPVLVPEQVVQVTGHDWQVESDKRL